ncbi:MAG: DNA repair protein RadC [Bacteroidaceae bacterium]|nr:DNA repair protein RadC [Bacteroidaceae bacterium]
MSKTLTIKQMSTADRPREKFIGHGPDAMSNSELLAILVGSGTVDETAVDLTRRMLADCNDRLSNLQRLTLKELQKYKGIGAARAVTIKAAMELARRRLTEEVGEKPHIQGAMDIARYFSPIIGHLKHEEAHALYMTNRNDVIRHEVIGKGGLNETTVDVRLVMKGAILNDAVAIALCHNHPSGSAMPSRQDDILTTRLSAAAEAMNLRFLDHVIVTEKGDYYSYSEEGRL